MPEDPAAFIEVLDRHRYFETVAIAREDLQRTQYYRADQERRTLEASATTVEDFLRSLQMQATLEPIGPLSRERSVQLINRSNQFNLTTRRRTAAELDALCGSTEWIARSVTLSDRLGDHGLISVVLARVVGPTLEIDTWLMSCRVLQRGVEQFLHNHLCSLALERGIERLRGEYVPTPRNVIVQDHYARLGFTQISSDASGRTLWELILTPEWRPMTTFIQERGSDGKPESAAGNRLPSGLR
jgi:FkbH-like protein